MTYVNVIICIYALYTVSAQLCHQETGLIMLALQLTVSFTETKERVNFERFEFI